ncbi:MAG: hypothetical protein ABIJ09_14735 [Pseudomonadota bacterium]
MARLLLFGDDIFTRASAEKQARLTYILKVVALVNEIIEFESFNTRRALVPFAVNDLARLVATAQKTSTDVEGQELALKYFTPEERDVTANELSSPSVEVQEFDNGPKDAARKLLADSLEIAQSSVRNIEAEVSETDAVPIWQNPRTAFCRRSAMTFAIKSLYGACRPGAENNESLEPLDQIFCILDTIGTEAPPVDAVELPRLSPELVRKRKKSKKA